LTVLAGSSARLRRRITNFSGKDFRAACVEGIKSESVGQQLLQVFGRNEVLIFSVFANEIGHVGAERHDAEMIAAREIQGGTGKSPCQAVAFEGLRHLSVVQDDASGKEAIREQASKSVNEKFETLCLFVVADGYVVEIHGQEFPRYLRLTGKV
jgi:hypothetical protein